jgi:hypothetical protein
VYLYYNQLRLQYPILSLHKSNLQHHTSSNTCTPSTAPDYASSNPTQVPSAFHPIHPTPCHRDAHRPVLPPSSGHELIVLLQGADFTGNSLLEPRPLFVRQPLDVCERLDAFLLALLDPAADLDRVAFDSSPSNIEDQVDDSNLAGTFEDRCFGEFGRRGDVDLEGLEVQLAEVAVDVCGRALDGLCVEAEEMEVATVAEAESQILDVLGQKPGVESSLFMIG